MAEHSFELSGRALRDYLPDFRARVEKFAADYGGSYASESERRIAARQLLHIVENRIQSWGVRSTRPYEVSRMDELLRLLSRARSAIGEAQNGADYVMLFQNLVIALMEWADIQTRERNKLAHSHRTTEAFLQAFESPELSIIVDSNVDPERLAEFLAELSSVYTELSEGDELIIKEGKVPVGEEVFA